MMAILLATIYFLDQVLSSFIASGTGVIITLSMLTLYSTDFEIIKKINKKNINFGIFFLFLSVVILLLSVILGPSEIDLLKSFAALIILFGCIVIMLGNSIFTSIITLAFSRKMIIATLITLVAIRYGLFTFNSFSGKLGQYVIFKEPSHFALYLLPFYTYGILSGKYIRFYLTIILVSIVLVPSLTLALAITFCAVIYFFGNLHSIKKKAMFYIAFTLSASFVLFRIIDVSRYIDRINPILDFGSSSPSLSSNLSSLVWLNGWSQAFETLKATNGIGLGVQQMGCGSFREIGEFSPIITKLAGSTLNYNDGSFLASKIISEFGFLGILFVLFIFIISILSILSYINCEKCLKYLNDNTRMDEIAISASGAICILTFLFIRGMGYFQLSFLLSLSMLFYYPKKKQK